MYQKMRSSLSLPGVFSEASFHPEAEFPAWEQVAH